MLPVTRGFDLLLLSLIVIFVSGPVCLRCPMMYTLPELIGTIWKECLACYFVLYTVLGSRTESPKHHHNWFPSQSDIFVRPPPMLTVTRCIVRSLQRAIKHICAGLKLSRAVDTRTHTRFLTFLSHRSLFLTLSRCRGEDAVASVPVDCGRSASGGILFSVWLVIDRQYGYPQPWDEFL